MIAISRIFTLFLLALVGFSTPLLAQDSQPLLITEINECESYILKQRSHYDVDEKFDSVTVLPLREWPVEIQRALYIATHETVDVPLIVDPLTIASYHRESHHLGYSHSASLLRSAIVEKENQKAYLAIYSAWAGEWGREKNHLEYFILDEQGNLIRSGYSRD